MVLENNSVQGVGKDEKWAYFQETKDRKIKY